MLSCSICETCSEHCLEKDPVECAARTAADAWLAYGPEDQHTEVAVEQLAFAYERTQGTSTGGARTAAKSEIARRIGAAVTFAAPPPGGAGSR